MKNLSANDTYARHGQDMYVLCFASSDHGIVEARIRDITKEIKQALARTKNEAFPVAHDVTDMVFVDAGEGSILGTIAEPLQ